MENVTTGRDGAHIMDLKIGTSTNTMRAQKKGPEKLAHGDKKDAERTNKEHGFSIIGTYAEGKKANYQAEKAKLLDHSRLDDYIKPIFVVENQVQVESCTWCLTEIDKMIDHFTNVNTFEIRGASLFFVLDHVKKSYALKLIDLASMESRDHCDEGFLLGLKNIRIRIESYTK